MLSVLVQDPAEYDLPVGGKQVAWHGMGRCLQVFGPLPGIRSDYWRTCLHGSLDAAPGGRPTT